MYSRKKSPASISIAIGAWGLAVVAGVLTLGAHAGRPGDAGSPGRSLAEGEPDPVRRDPAEPPDLPAPPLPVLAGQPRRAGPRHDAMAAIGSRPGRSSCEPSGAPDGWADSDIARDAAAIPGVLTFRDEDGDEARRFGAATSGHVMLYDAAGRLHFSGGITPARGHEGDSLGRDAVIDLIEAMRVGGTAVQPRVRLPARDASVRLPDRRSTR